VKFAFILSAMAATIPAVILGVNNGFTLLAVICMAAFGWKALAR
jgi:hypothetical protein